MWIFPKSETGTEKLNVKSDYDPLETGRLLLPLQSAHITVFLFIFTIYLLSLHVIMGLRSS